MKPQLSYLGIAIIVFAVSCGGDDTAKTFDPASMSVQNLQRMAALSMAEGGMPVASYGVAGSSGVDVPSIGAFVRRFGGLNGTGPTLLKRALAPSAEAASGGQSFSYDGSLHLWVATRWSGSTFSDSFYIDQSKTQPAGHLTLTSSTGWTSYPQSYKGDYAFTAGKLNGTSGSYTCTQTSPLAGFMSYKAAYADSAHVTGMSSWTGAGAKWQSEWDGPGKAGWYKDSGSWSADRSGGYTLKASDGEAAVWTFKPDGSGSAHFEGGSAVKLPADISWTGAGNFKATFADKSNDEWTWSDVWTPTDKVGTVTLVSAPATAIAEKVAPDAKKDSASPSQTGTTK
ncbi:MAG TPA: hypothetical protein VMI31_00695 [Fimbriimonadaceae bacterium]|nr:hypothetical protein [Fimbriimonadaceae bacterium]